jgi:DNA-binding transcriptional LysR family regulator
MELRHFETFLKIAQLKSFTKAAAELYLTQPTVSKQIVDLEGFLGVRLIDRNKRTVTLTRAGEILLQYAKEMVNLKKEAIDAIGAFKGLKRGNITVGASTIPGIYILPKLLGMFKKQYEGIGIKLVVTDTQGIIEQLEEGDIDIGFVGAKVPSQKIEYKKFIDDIIVTVAPPDFPDTVSISDIKRYPFIIREKGSGTRNTFEGALKKIKDLTATDLTVTAELTDTEAIKEAVKGGMGISYMSRLAIVDDVASGRLKSISINGLPEIKRSFYVITRKGKTMLPQTKALLEIIDKWRKYEKV